MARGKIEFRGLIKQARKKLTLDSIQPFGLKERVLDLLLALVLERPGQRKDRKGAHI